MIAHSKEHSSSGAWIAGLGGIVLLGFVFFSSLAAVLAWSEGSPTSCLSLTPIASQNANTTATVNIAPQRTSSPSVSPSATSSAGSGCVPPGRNGGLVVQWATAMANALYVNPVCGGQISYPNCYYTWYKAPGTSYPPGAPTFPEAVILYGGRVCPGCSSWANGTFQCVSFVLGAYSQIDPLPFGPDAFAFWAAYSHQPNWVEIPSGAAPPAERGIPQPGDVMVFKDTGVGHVAIVMRVLLPSQTAHGSITFSNANSVSPYTTMPLLPDLTVDTSSWPGYTVWGYIRPRNSTPFSTPSAVSQGHSRFSFLVYPAQLALSILFLESKGIPGEKRELVSTRSTLHGCRRLACPDPVSSEPCIDSPVKGAVSCL